MVDKEVEQLARVKECRIGLNSKHKGTTGGSYTANIETNHPTYLVYLYQYSTGIYGDTATFQKLANALNAKAATEDVIPNLQLSKWQLKQWVAQCLWEPYLTDEQRETWVWYAMRMLDFDSAKKNYCLPGWEVVLYHFSTKKNEVPPKTRIWSRRCRQA
jgi:hypothetical protein